MTLMLSTAFALIAGLLLGQPGPVPSKPSRAEATVNIAEIPVPDLEAKLGRLSPSDAVGYYRLAEEVAEERQAPGARNLARSLYVLAFNLDRSSAQSTGVAHSACLGLAALAANQPEKRWLRALAAQEDPSDPDAQAHLQRLSAATIPISDRSALQIATALGYIRASEGRRALQLLDRPGNWEVVQEFEGILEGGAPRIRSLAEQWTGCPQCHNRRIIMTRNGKEQVATLCPTCGGIPGPKLSLSELLGQLRLEVSLLRGIHKVWSSQLLADGGEPLRDPNPADLAITYRVDIDAVLWRNGHWEPDPSRPKPAGPAPKPGDKPADAAAPTTPATPPAAKPPKSAQPKPTDPPPNSG